MKTHGLGALSKPHYWILNLESIFEPVSLWVTSSKVGALLCSWMIAFFLI